MREQMKFELGLSALIIGFMLCSSCSQNQTRKADGKLVEKSILEENDTVSLISDLNVNQTRSLKSKLTDGNIDGYWIRLPYKYNKQKLWPIMVYFHGRLVEPDLDSIYNAGATLYTIQDTSQAGDLCNQILSNFIIITPHLKGTGEKHPRFGPSWTKEFITIDAILDSVINKYSGNTEKIYLTGPSLGGAANWQSPNYLKNPIAAVVPVCGNPQGYYGSSDPRPKEKTSTEPLEIFNANPFKTVPVRNTCNARDGWPKRVFQETAVNKIEALGGEKFLKLSTAKPSDTAYLKHKRIFTSYDKSGHDA